MSDRSQAIQIPAELAYDDAEQELTITRMGDVITIFPAKETLKQMVQDLRSMPKPSEAEVREPIEMRGTNWD